MSFEPAAICTTCSARWILPSRSPRCSCCATGVLPSSSIRSSDTPCRSWATSSTTGTVLRAPSASNAIALDAFCLQRWATRSCRCIVAPGAGAGRWSTRRSSDLGSRLPVPRMVRAGGGALHHRRRDRREGSPDRPPQCFHRAPAPGGREPDDGGHCQESSPVEAGRQGDRAGQGLEIAVAIGNHAAVLLGSQLYLGLGDDEFEIAGAHAGRAAGTRALPDGGPGSPGSRRDRHRGPAASGCSRSRKGRCRNFPASTSATARVSPSGKRRHPPPAADLSGHPAGLRTASIACWAPSRSGRPDP